MKTKIIPIKQAKCDEKYYPRTKMDWLTSYKYAKAMKAGAEFPNIVVAELNKELIVVDGFHRLKALEQNKETHVQADILEGLDEKQIYLEAIKRNIGHGRQFNSQERVKIILTLRDWELSEQQISEIVRIPTDDLKPFVAKRITRITETQEEIPLKAPLRHLSETTVSSPIDQGVFSNRDQISILDSLISLLENGWLNLERQIVREKVEKVYKLLELQYAK